jgi:hypothetical protein
VGLRRGKGEVRMGWEPTSGAGGRRGRGRGARAGAESPA